MAVKDSGKEISSPSKFDLAKETFETVLSANEHEDNKASRILGAMAFLTAASAAIFSRVSIAPTSQLIFPVPHIRPLGPCLVLTWAPRWLKNFARSPSQPKFLGVDWDLLMFCVYIVFVLLGALFYLNALGPALNKPSSLWPKRQESSKPRSLLFFDEIAKVGVENWKSYWQQKRSEDLSDEMLNNFVMESRLIADKTRTKYRFMRLGGFFFRMSFFFLSILAARLFVPVPKAVLFFTWFSVGSLTTVWSFVRPNLPPRESPRWIGFILWTLSAVFLVASLAALICL